MSVRDEFIRVSEAAHLLGVSERRVQQMAASGDLTFTARGLVDRTSLDHHLAARQGSRTRAWSTETAWAAVALLCGVEVDWLGSVQRSRLRKSLRDTDAQALVSRTRNRARIHRYTGHSSTAARLRNEIRVVHLASELGITGDEGQFDGYVATTSLADLVMRHALIEDPQGQHALRATDFDLDDIAAIASAGEIPVLAALDSAEALDARERGVALETLEQALAQFRG
jgi:excisionase family DNA binding protein